MKNKSVMKLFAVILAVSMAATNVPAMAIPVYADNTAEPVKEQVGVTKDNIGNILDYSELNNLNLTYNGE